MVEIDKLAKQLKLPFIRSNYKDILETAKQKGFTYQTFLEVILESEVKQRDQNGIRLKKQFAKFPYIRPYEDLDLTSYKPQTALQIRELSDMGFLDKGKNVILIGNPGVGKTHLAIALGLKACEMNKTVLYITIPYLITELKESMSKNRLTTFRKQLMSYDLIIEDELGYCSFDKEGSELLFNFFSMRNEFKSTIITTNLTFKDWPSVFGDNTLSAALIDRLTHRAIILNMSGESHRHKEALQNMKVAQN
ncbi:MAG: IS21-like element helper ATPase IstB [Bacilli bacterium]